MDRLPTQDTKQDPDTDHVGDLLGEAFAHALVEPQAHQGRAGINAQPDITDSMHKYRDIGDESPSSELNNLHIPEPVDERSNSYVPRESNNQEAPQEEKGFFGGWFGGDKTEKNADNAGASNDPRGSAEEPRMGMFSSILQCLPVPSVTLESTPNGKTSRKAPRLISHSKLKPVSPDGVAPMKQLDELLGMGAFSMSHSHADDDVLQSAKKLQSVWRGKAQRMEGQAVSKGAHAVQKFWRMKGRWKAMYSVARVAMEHHRAVTVIQRNWRGRNTRGFMKKVVLASPKLCTQHTIHWLTLMGHKILTPGVEVLAQYGSVRRGHGDGFYYRATVVRDNGDGTYHLHYEGGSEWRVAPMGMIKMDVSGADLEPDCLVDEESAVIAPMSSQVDAEYEFVFENSRWISFDGWDALSLRRPWSSEDGQRGGKSFEDFKPGATKADWTVFKNMHTDADGWQYAVSFDATTWRTQCFRNAVVRRRRWAEVSALSASAQRGLSLGGVFATTARRQLSLADLSLLLGDRNVKEQQRRKQQQDTWDKERANQEIMRHDIAVEAMKQAKKRLQRATKRAMMWWFVLCVLTSALAGAFYSADAKAVWGERSISAAVNLTVRVPIPSPSPTPVPTWVNGSWGASADNATVAPSHGYPTEKVTWSLENWCEAVHLDKPVRSPWGGYTSLVFCYCGWAVLCMASVGTSMLGPVRADEEGNLVEPDCMQAHVGCCFGSKPVPGKSDQSKTKRSSRAVGCCCCFGSVAVSSENGQSRTNQRPGHHTQFRRRQGPVASGEAKPTNRAQDHLVKEVASPSTRDTCRDEPLSSFGHTKSTPALPVRTAHLHRVTSVNSGFTGTVNTATATLLILSTATRYTLDSVNRNTPSIPVVTTQSPCRTVNNNIHPHPTHTRYCDTHYTNDAHPQSTTLQLGELRPNKLATNHLSPSPPPPASRPKKTSDAAWYVEQIHQRSGRRDHGYSREPCRPRVGPLQPPGEWAPSVASAYSVVDPYNV
jgi:hypothetical protein